MTTNFGIVSKTNYGKLARTILENSEKTIFDDFGKLLKKVRDLKRLVPPRRDELNRGVRRVQHLDM